MVTNQGSPLAFLQALPENQFTLDVMVPLLRKIGYTDIHFHGGGYEAGKDLIGSKRGDFGQLEVLAAQVKKFKSARSTQNRQQWDAVVYQLRQMKDRDIACKDGKARKPTQLLFVTPFTIETRLLEEQLSAVGSTGITIIDGAGLESLLKEHWPTMLADIGGLDGKVAAASTGALKNTELFESLRLANQVPYENIYSDLNFFVGRADTRELFSCTIQASDPPTEFTWESWLDIKQNLVAIEALTKLQIVSQQAETIEDQYRTEQTAHLSEANKAIYHRLESTNEALQQQVRQFDALLIGLSKLIQQADANDPLLAQLETELRSLRDKVVAGERSSNVTLVDLQQQTTSAHPRLSKLLHNLQLISILLVQMQTSADEIVDLRSHYRPAPSIKFALNTSVLCTDINSRLEWLREKAHAINNGTLAPSSLASFLTKVEVLLSLINRLVYKKLFVKPVFTLTTQTAFCNRFALSAHHVFDSGKNVAVYGEAGAGKSTTLHMYAKRRSDAIGPKQNEAVVFLPMNRVMIASIQHGYDGAQDSLKGEPVRALVKAILIYLHAEPSDQGIDEFNVWIRTKSRVVLVIDGLDEAVTHNQWILQAINKLPETYRNAQMIISSRDCIDEIHDIDFLGITLLPFTPEQLRKFIEGWSPKGQELWNAISTTPLAEVATNPLLATIVCSLKEHGIKVVANEPDVYRKKIQLLCGHYDQVKRVNRTKTPPDILESVAQTLAFEMHCKHVREIDYNRIEQILLSAYQDRIEDHALQLAAKELVSPCNVLIRIPNTGSVTFGHLRYQEFLASERLLRTNDRSSLDFLYDEWWRGAMYLYAFSADIEGLIESAYRNGISLSKAHGTLKAMIRARPKIKQQHLLTLLKRYCQQELEDQLFPRETMDDFEIEDSGAGWSEFRELRLKGLGID